MLKALFTALLAAWMASALASYAQSPTAPAAKARSTDHTTRMKLQAVQADAETVKVRAVYSPDIRPNPPQALASTDTETDPGESGWRSYGMLLATLVLMGVIAVRRYKAGRP